MSPPPQEITVRTPVRIKVKIKIMAKANKYKQYNKILFCIRFFVHGLFSYQGQKATHDRQAAN